MSDQNSKQGGTIKPETQGSRIKGAPKSSQLSVGTVALLTSATVLSLRGLPMMAKEGIAMWFYIGFATLFFLIPGALARDGD